MVSDPRYGFIFSIPTVNQLDDLQSWIACLFNFIIDDVLDCFFSCLSSWLAQAGRATALDDRNPQLLTQNKIILSKLTCLCGTPLMKCELFLPIIRQGNCVCVLSHGRLECLVLSFSQDESCDAQL
jgi:hypothetical protein